MDFNYLIHYGMPRRSGRYPWGSGKNPKRSKEFKKASKESTINQEKELEKIYKNRYPIKKSKAAITLTESTLKEANSKGVKIDDGNNIYLPKGLKMYRTSSNKNEPIDDKRKYLSFLNRDVEIYSGPDFLDFQTNYNEKSQTFYKNEYVLNKELKLLSPLKVYEIFNNFDNPNKLKIKDNSNFYKMSKKGEKIEREILENLSEEMDKNDKDSFSTFLSKKGYDGVIDVVDSRLTGDYTSMPVILFNPQNKIKQIKSDKLDY